MGWIKKIRPILRSNFRGIAWLAPAEVIAVMMISSCSKHNAFIHGPVWNRG